MLAWTPPAMLMNTGHSAPSLSPLAGGILSVAARIPLAGLASHRAGAVHLTGPEAPLWPPGMLAAVVAEESDAPEPCPTATEGPPDFAAAAAGAGAGEDSIPASFG